MAVTFLGINIFHDKGKCVTNAYRKKTHQKIGSPSAVDSVV